LLAICADFANVMRSDAFLDTPLDTWIRFHHGFVKE
jgi:hypothetical protein